MALASFFNLLSLLFLCLIQFFSFLEANGGLSFDLIHRESPKSPFFNPLNTQFDRLHNALRRSTFRYSHLSQISTKCSSSSGKTQSQLISGGGEYLMKFWIGTPPVEVLSIADTGSDVSWIQCKPCTECYPQKTPIFDPKRSSTYRNLGCESELCQEARNPGCEENVCQYSVSYGDNSYTNGDLALEKFTFNSSSAKPVSFPKVAFGCGHENGGTFNDTGSGLIGLGTSPLSLINQIKAFGGKFSYCLVPWTSEETSTINFGRNAVVTGPGVVSTPYKTGDPDSFYYLTLESITIGKKNVPYKNSKVGSEFAKGNIIIDSGTTLTFLPIEFYSHLRSALVKSIKGTRVKDPTGQLELCYSIEKGDIKVPTVTAHFSGGANLELSQFSTFVLIQKGVVCFSMVPAGSIAIFGNLSQMNYLVGYDTVKKEVSFKPTDCTKY